MSFCLRWMTQTIGGLFVTRWLGKRSSSLTSRLMQFKVFRNQSFLHLPLILTRWVAEESPWFQHSSSVSLSLPSLSLSLQPYVDHFTHEKELHPLSSTVKPKSSFIPSRWEHKKIVKIAHAIRMGWIKPRESPAQRRPNFYLLWGDSDKASQQNLSTWQTLDLVDCLLRKVFTEIRRLSS